MINGRSDRVLHDDGKQFTSRISDFSLYKITHFKDKRIPLLFPVIGENRDA